MRIEPLSFEQIAEAIALHDDEPRKWTYVALAKRYRLSVSTLYYALYPEKRQHKNEYKRLRARRNVQVSKQLRQAELLKSLRSIPQDTRDYTARFFGDPLPGRSALDGCGKRAVNSARSEEKHVVPERCVWRFGG